MAKTKTINPRDIEAEKFIKALALELKKIKEFEAPEWTLFVKTGASKQRQPENDEWWYVRAASILRALYVKGVVGVERLRTKYGSRKKRGMAPEKYFKSSGKIIRSFYSKPQRQTWLSI